MSSCVSALISQTGPGVDRDPQSSGGWVSQPSSSNDSQLGGEIILSRLFFIDLACNDAFTGLRVERCVVFISSEDATLFVGCEDSRDFALRLRIDVSCSSSEIKSSGSPKTLRLPPTFVSSDPEESLATIMLGALLHAFLVAVVRTTSTLLRPCTDFGTPLRSDESLPSTIRSSDSIIAFCDLGRSVNGAGDGDRLESSSSSLSSALMLLVAFPPPICLLMRVMARFKRRAGPS